MALPIVLSPKWYSIAPKATPNGINFTSPTGNNLPQGGIIDNVNTVYDPIFGIGQYVTFQVNDDTVKVRYSNKDYYIVHERDILYKENAVIPPP